MPIPFGVRIRAVYLLCFTLGQFRCRISLTELMLSGRVNHNPPSGVITVSLRIRCKRPWHRPQRCRRCRRVGRRCRRPGNSCFNPRAEYPAPSPAPLRPPILRAQDSDDIICKPFANIGDRVPRRHGNRHRRNGHIGRKRRSSADEDSGNIEVFILHGISSFS